MDVKLSGDAARRLADAALDFIERDLAPDMVSDARRAAPVDSGELRASIGSRRAGDSVQIYADADHARYVELGTSRAPAQPYLRPAVMKRRG